MYKFEKDIEGDEEYCKKYLLAYSSLDILEDIMLTTNKDFLYSINKQGSTVSVFLFRCGFKLMLITEGKGESEVYSIGKSLADIFRNFIIKEWADLDDVIVSEKLNKSVEAVLGSKHSGIHNI